MLEAVATGVIANVIGALFTAVLQRRATSKSIFEITPEVHTVIVRHSLLRFGPLSVERTSTETRIEAQTIRMAEPAAFLRWRPLPLAVGVALGLAVFAAALYAV